MTRIQYVLWDVMDTLVHDPFFEEMPAFFGLSSAELIAAKHPDNWIFFERREVSEEKLLDDFFADGREFDREAFKATVQDAYRFLPGMESVLADMLAQGVEQHALSNYPDWYRWIEDRLALSRYLTWSFVSCDTGYRKPDARAFLHACEQLGAKPQECLFVDDREGNCEGAREVGLKSILFESADQVRRELRTLGLL